MPDGLRPVVQFVELTAIDAADMQPQAQLKDDLDIDSLDGLDLLLAMNKTFGVKVPEERMQGIRTLQDVYDVAAEVIAEQSGTTSTT